MKTKPLTPSGGLPVQQHAASGQEWLAEVMSIWKEHYPELAGDDELRQHAGRLLDELVVVFAAHLADSPPDSAAPGELAATARSLAAHCAKAGFKAENTAQYVRALKNVLTGRLVSDLSQSPADLAACLTAVDDVLDRLPLLTFAAYAEVRETIVAQKSLAAIALSAPVILLCDQVLMLPLVGVINAPRTHEFTVRLIEAISRDKATVVVIDVTGVPKFDTHVARHIRRTVDATQVLGASVVMTGIGAEDVQVMTALGDGFASVTCCATLHAGVAEALNSLTRRPP